MPQAIYLLKSYIQENTKCSPPAKPHSKQPAHTDCSFIQKPLYWIILSETEGVKSVPHKVTEKVPAPKAGSSPSKISLLTTPFALFSEQFLSQLKIQKYGVQKCKETKNQTWIPLPIIRLTALFPPPPTPMTLIRAPSMLEPKALTKLLLQNLPSLAAILQICSCGFSPQNCALEVLEACHCVIVLRSSDGEKMLPR
jgi:hypothetical protein